MGALQFYMSTATSGPGSNHHDDLPHTTHEQKLLCKLFGTAAGRKGVKTCVTVV